MVLQGVNRFGWKVERRISSDSCIEDWLLFEDNDHDKEHGVKLSQEGDQKLVVRITKLNSILYKDVVEDYEAIITRARLSCVARQRRPEPNLLTINYYKLPLGVRNIYYLVYNQDVDRAHDWMNHFADILQAEHNVLCSPEQ